MHFQILATHTPQNQLGTFSVYGSIKSKFMGLTFSILMDFPMYYDRKSMELSILYFKDLLAEIIKI